VQAALQHGRLLACQINNALTPVAFKWSDSPPLCSSGDLGEAEACCQRVAGQGEPMAMILEFRTRHVPAEPSEREESAGAQIIIFPGVRRERHVVQTAKPARRARGRPKRDRLELPD